MKKIFVGLATLCVAVSLLSIAPAKAATGLQISPLTYNFEVKAGETKRASIIVTNLNDAPTDYVTEIELFNQINEEGAPSFAVANSDPGVTTIKDWIVFDAATKQGTLEAKKEVEVYFDINVPVGADPGGHYAAVFAKETTKTAEGKTNISVNTRVGTLILVSIPGVVTKGATVTDFVSPKFVWGGPTDFSFKVNNTGTVHYDSSGIVSVEPSFAIGGKQEVDMGKHTVLPKTTRAYKGSWTAKYPFGIYKAIPSSTDGNGAEIALASTTIIAIPLIIVVPSLVALIILILIIMYIKRHVRFVDDK